MTQKSTLTDDRGPKVDVYRNLNRDTLSIRSRHSRDYGTVFAYKDACMVGNAELVVQPAGRQRVLDTGTRNVHAFVRGILLTELPVKEGREVTYNPFDFENFVYSDTEEPVHEAKYVSLIDDEVYINESE